MKKFARVLAMLMALTMMLSMTAFAAENKTTWIRMSLEDDEGKNGQTYRVCLTDESSHYLTEEAPLLVEIVSIINKMYDPNDSSTPMWDFDSKAMKEVMDDGLDAFADGEQAWEAFVDQHFDDVNNVTGDRELKSLLMDRSSVLGDLIPNIAHKVSFQNDVKSDKKYGVTYTLTITRYTDVAPALELDGAHKAYVAGYPDGTVRPNATITRAEVATIFYRAMTEGSRDYYLSENNNFIDVAANAWYNEAVSTMAAAGVLRGYDDGTFRPDAPVTRAEFASIITRMTEEGMGDFKHTFQGYFGDVAKGAWYTPAVELANELGWAQGHNGMYRPNDNMTRAEVMTMVNRVLKRDVQEEGMLEGMIEWPDNTADKWYYEAVQEATNGHTYERTGEQVENQTYNYENWIALVK